MSPANPLRCLRLDLAYDGTEFAGWQFQPGQRTVQGELERVLTVLAGGYPVRVRGAGRTDAGVHAERQVADAMIATRHDDARLAHSLRALLAPDLRAVCVQTVPAAFHSQRDAVSKTYRYRIDRSSHGNPLSARYALHHPRPLDLDAIESAVARLPGRRDWSGFTASSCTVPDRVRNLEAARLERSRADEFRLIFRADGFLRYMVRNLVGTLLQIGRGRMQASRIERILDTGDRGLAGPTAPPHGLCLVRVAYAGELDQLE